MTILTIISVIVAVIAIILALLAFVANRITIDYIHKFEEENEVKFNNLSDAIRTHAIDKDLHKTESRKSKK